MTNGPMTLRIITTRKFKDMTEFRNYLLEMATRGLQIEADQLLRDGIWVLRSHNKGEVVETDFQLLPRLEERIMEEDVREKEFQDGQFGAGA